jgi:hypothetical protein
MEKIHHQEIVPGEKDFALGFASFEKLRKKVKISILAANLYKPSEVKKSDPKPFYKPYEIVVGKDKNGKKVRVAILGLVGHTLVWPKELKALPAQKIAKKYISLLKKQADYVIALTHQGLAEDQELAKKVPGFDFIVGGHTQSFLQVPVQEGKTFILQSSFRNQYIGVAPLEKPFEKEHYKLIAVDAGYESPAEAPSEMDQFVKEFKHSIAELNSKQDEMLKNEVEAKTLAGKQVHFQTFPSCAECHLKQFDFWRKTDHANALTALVGKEQAQNKECLTCHTVGLGNPNGFNSVKQLVQVRKKGEDDEFTVQDLSLEDSEYFLKSIHKARSLKSDVKMSKEASEEIPMRKALSSVVKAWAPVQCENCHGPGKGHPFSGKYSKKVETSACLSCHTQDRAPDWYGQDGKPKTDLINSKRGLVSCPAGELAEEDE